jgi:hypothetical protein
MAGDRLQESVGRDVMTAKGELAGSEEIFLLRTHSQPPDGRRTCGNGVMMIQQETF